MKRLLFLSLGLAVFITSCDLVGDLVVVPLPFPPVDVTLAPNPNLEFEIEETVAFEDIKTEIDDAGFSVDVISSLQLKEVVLDITSGTYTWDKVEEMTLSVNDGTTTTEVANLPTFADNSKVSLNEAMSTATITIPEEEQIDLKGFLSASQITYKFNLKLKEELTEEITVRATASADGRF